MNDLFNNILSNTSGNITPVMALITMLTALVLGFIVAVTYYITHDEWSSQRSLAVSFVMLPIVLSMIILFVGSNVARAFSLAGTLAIIRFRSAPADAKEIGYIFFVTAVGLACGVGFFGYAAMFTLILCLVLIVVEKFKIFEPKCVKKILKITIPENLNYEGTFDEILSRYTKKYTLAKIRTTDLGSLFELCYEVIVDNSQNEQEFINELRCRNGNLNIILALAPKSEKLKG